MLAFETRGRKVGTKFLVIFNHLLGEILSGMTLSGTGIHVIAELGFLSCHDIYHGILNGPSFLDGIRIKTVAKK